MSGKTILFVVLVPLMLALACGIFDEQQPAPVKADPEPRLRVAEQVPNTLRCDIELRQFLAGSTVWVATADGANVGVSYVQSQYAENCPPSRWNPRVSEVAVDDAGNIDLSFASPSVAPDGNPVTTTGEETLRWVYLAEDSRWYAVAPDHPTAPRETRSDARETTAGITAPAPTPVLPCNEQLRKVFRDSSLTTTHTSNANAAVANIQASTPAHCGPDAWDLHVTAVARDHRGNIDVTMTTADGSHRWVYLTDNNQWHSSGIDDPTRLESSSTPPSASELQPRPVHVRGPAHTPTPASVTLTRRHGHDAETIQHGEVAGKVLPWSIENQALYNYRSITSADKTQRWTCIEADRPRINITHPAAHTVAATVAGRTAKDKDTFVNGELYELAWAAWLQNPEWTPEEHALNVRHEQALELKRALMSSGAKSFSVSIGTPPVVGHYSTDGLMTALAENEMECFK